MTITTNEKVLRLKVSMYDTLRVEVLEGGHYMSEVELGPQGIKEANSLEKRAKVSTLHKLHDHVEVLAALEGVHPTHDEVVVDLGQDFFFIENEILNIFLNHDLLV